MGIRPTRPLFLFLAAVIVANLPAAPSPSADAPARRAQLRVDTVAAVTQALAAGPGQAGAAVQLRGAAIEGRRLTLDFSRELLDLGLGALAFEQTLRAAHRAAAEVLREDWPEIEIDTSIEGIPLPRWFAVQADARPPVAANARPADPARPPAAGLLNRRIAVSPGHGYYWNGSTWVLQRSYFQGVVEDFVNHDFITLLAGELASVGADVWPTRNLDRTAGNGESGFSKWQEAARYHVKELGAPASVWNEAGYDHLSQDIRCRPLYANWVGAELLVSLHNNGGGGTGTETLYDNANAAAAGSKRLADLLHAKVLAAIRRDYDPAWTDRRVQGFNGSYGENRLATRPAVIIEVAFMDKPLPDNAAIQSARFRQIVAQAIADGISEFLYGPLPLAPDTLIAAADATGIALTWTDRATNETSLRVERRAAGGDWGTLATLAPNTRAYRDSAAVVGTAYTYRVGALNAAGSSAQFSNEAEAAVATPLLALAFTAVAPVASITCGWDEEAVVAFTVTDAVGRLVAGAEVAVADGLRRSIATLVADEAGRVTYRTRVPVGQAEGAYELTFLARRAGYMPSTPLVCGVQVRPAGGSGRPVLIAQPAALDVTAGEPAVFAVTAGGPGPFSYQWRRNGVALPGATLASLALPPVATGDAGDYAVAVTNDAGTTSSLAAALAVHPAAWLTNLSVRTTLSAAQTLMVGFVVGGGTKDILVRAAGPALVPFGLPTAMADPRLEVYRGGTRVAANNDWPAALGPAMVALGAFPFGSASRDAAVVQAFGGAHTALVSGPAGGVVLVEAYDASGGNVVRCINLSARNRAGTGADTLIAGFQVAGRGSRRLLIRAVGPGLADFGVPGVLADPRLEVRDGDAVIASNDDWESGLAATFAQVNAFPLVAGSRDAALLVTLAAGRGYTVQVAAAGAPGEALIEVYEVP